MIIINNKQKALKRPKMFTKTNNMRTKDFITGLVLLTGIFLMIIL